MLPVKMKRVNVSAFVIGNEKIKIKKKKREKLQKIFLKYVVRKSTLTLYQRAIFVKWN